MRARTSFVALPVNWASNGFARPVVMSDGNTKTVAPDVPIHCGRQIGPPLFYKILEQLGIDEKRFGQLR